MNESVPAPPEEPKQSADEKTDKPEKIIIENQPISISIPSKGIRWGAVVEWVLVGITIVLAIYTVKTAQYASDQARAAIIADSIAIESLKYQARIDSENSIKQDRKDALFIKSQNERDSLNRESFILENRAYIIFKTVSIDTVDFKDRGNQMKVKVINTGNTPARYTTSFVGFSLIEDSIKSLFQKGRKFLQSSPPKGYFIAANDSATLTTSLGDPKITKPIIFKPSNTIYFFGIIKYFDIFRIRRWTYFCIEWKGGSTLMKTYKKYNEVY